MKLSFTDTISDFLFFLSSPTSERVRSRHLGLANIIGLFLILFFADLILFGLIMQFIGVEQMDHKFNEAFADEGLFFMIMVVVVLAPVFEECIFRYPLRYAKPSFFLIAMSVSYFIIDVLNVEIHIALQGIIGLFLAALMTLLVMYKATNWWTAIHKDYFPFIFYYVVAIFAFLHIYNFNLESLSWYQAPFLVVPQFILGIYLGYVRIRNNIWSSIIIHAINNIIPLVLFLSINNN